MARLLHGAFVVGLRNRFSVMLDWFWAYLTFRSDTRLITGGGQNGAAALPRAIAPPLAVVER